VIVDELDHALVSEIDAAAGPAPQWFGPVRASIGATMFRSARRSCSPQRPAVAT
jgi:hypothetical protein